MKHRIHHEVDHAASDHFRRMVESVGITKFADGMGLSTRQVNRLLSGSQPNPIGRLIQCLLSCDPETGDRVIDFICQEMGGYFVREEDVDRGSINAVKECAEAIAAISDGEISHVDEIEIRDAVTALIALARSVKAQRESRLRPGRRAV